MEEKNCCLEEFLRKNKFVPQRKKVIGIVCGKAMRKGICFETSISFNEKTKKYNVTGQGEGVYATLKEVTIAIAIPETRGGARPNTGGYRPNSGAKKGGKGGPGRKKIGDGTKSKSLSCSAKERTTIQLVAEYCGISFAAYVKRAALNAVSN